MTLLWNSNSPDFPDLEKFVPVSKFINPEKKVKKQISIYLL